MRRSRRTFFCGIYSDKLIDVDQPGFNNLKLQTFMMITQGFMFSEITQHSLISGSAMRLLLDDIQHVPTQLVF